MLQKGLIFVFAIVVGLVLFPFADDAFAQPGAPHSPDPANGATGVGLNAQLSWGSGVLFGIRDSFDGTYVIDIATGIPTLIGPSAVTGLTVGLAHSGSSLLYGSAPFGLTHIQTDGGGATTFGSTGMEGMTFDPVTGTLYAAINGSFFTLDPATGNLLVSLPSWPGDVEGLAFDPSTGAQGTVFGLAGFSGPLGMLYAYDVATNSISTVGDTGLGSDASLCGLAYAPGLDVLFTVGSVTGDLYSINKTTAVTAFIANTGITSFAGLAFGLPSAARAIAQDWGGWRPGSVRNAERSTNGETAALYSSLEDAIFDGDAARVPTDVQDALLSVIVDSGILDGPISVTLSNDSESGKAGTYTYTKPEEVAQVRTAAGMGIQTRAVLDVVICGAPGTASFNVDIQTKLLGTGQFNSVSIIDAGAVTPTLSALQAFDSAMVFLNAAYADTTALGNVMADYVDSGGGVVSTLFEVAANGSGWMQGRWQAEGYFAIPRGGWISGSATLGTVFDSGHPIMAGVSSFDGGANSFRPATTSIVGGATRIADWSDGTPLVVTMTIGGVRRADLAFYPPSSDASGTLWDSTSDGALLMANALTWVKGVSVTTHDVLFDTSNPPTTLICDDTSLTTCDPGTLAPGTTYYWRVTSTNFSGSTVGNVWSFTTAGSAGGTVEFPSTDVPRAIPDLSTITSTLFVGTSGVIEDLNVELNITHTWDSDLDVFLRSPEGTTVELFTDVGVGEQNFTDTVLDDEAVTSITAGSGPFTGSFRPEGLLSAFDGENALGTWTLTITDDFGIDTGTLNSWSITIDFAGGDFLSADVPKPLPDLATVTSTLTISEHLLIGDADVLLDITHTYDADLQVFLTSPEGSTVELFTQVGGSGNNFTDTVLDDEAGTSITVGAAPFTGSFRPEGSLSVFDGEYVAGDWTLTIIDIFFADSGTLNSWGLRFLGTPVGSAVMWVDFGHVGAEDGTPSNPYNTYQEGHNALDPGGLLKINAGSSAETPVMNKPMTVRAAGGTVTIGAP